MFRLILFAVFTLLSWRASRNSHQFAAVVGAITAWNLGEWAAAVARSRKARGLEPGRAWGRVVAYAAVLGLLGLTGTEALYRWEGEGRTIGLGEEPHWFPHEAMALAGRPDMPPNSVCFHNGHSALYEYDYAPERKTYADARLEVMGLEVYQDYLKLDGEISQNLPAWRETLARMGLPLVVLDNTQATGASRVASLLADSRYRCVWFDEVAAVFIHESYRGASATYGIDFTARHFGQGSPEPPHDEVAEQMLAKTSWNIVHSFLIPSPTLRPRARSGDLARRWVWTGLDHARKLQAARPDLAAGWKWAGMLEIYRDESLTAPPLSRFAEPFDPVLDLSGCRASHDLRRALELDPRDVNSLVSQAGIDSRRGMFGPAVARFDQLLARRPGNGQERATQDQARIERDKVASRLGPAPGPANWANLSELDRTTADLIRRGWVEEVARLLESASPPDTRPWAAADRIASIRLHLGHAGAALDEWTRAQNPPSEALRQARRGAALLCLGQFGPAREAYVAALRDQPKLFEASYGLGILEADAGRAPEAIQALAQAIASSPSKIHQSAVVRLTAEITPYVEPVKPKATGAP